jgi:hypothetical protein
MPPIEVPVTIDTTSARAVAEAIAHYHRSLASDAGYALEALTKRLDEIEVERLAAIALKATEAERGEVTDTPDRFETDEEAVAAGADPAEIGDTHRVEITD